MTSIFNYTRSSKASHIPDETKNTSVFKFKKPKEEPAEEVQYPYENENDLEREIERNTARGLSRMGERILGLPGDVQSLAYGLIGLDSFLPTSEQLKAGSEKLTGGYTKAQTEFEEKGDEVLGDIATMMIPGGKTNTILRTIGIPVAANLGKEWLKKSGVGEKGSQWAKIAIMVGLDMIMNRGGGSAKYIGELFQKSESAIPQGITIDAKALENGIGSLKTVLQRGGSSSRTTKALQKIGEIEDKIQGGQIDPKEIPAFRVTINSAIDDLGGWDMATSPANRRQAIKHLSDVKKEIIEAGERYGKQNPEFLEAWNEANQAAAVAGKSNLMTNLIEKVVGKKAGTATKALFGVGGGVKAALSPSILASAAGGAAGYSAYQAFKVLYRVINSPSLAKYYKGVVTGAAKGNAAQTAANLKALDQKLKEEDKDEKKRITDLLQK